MLHALSMTIIVLVKRYGKDFQQIKNKSVGIMKVWESVIIKILKVIKF